MHFAIPTLLLIKIILMNAMKNKEHIFFHDTDDGMVVVKIELKKPTTTGSQNYWQQHHIVNGLCTNCHHSNQCVWAHNNKINCEHYK